MAQGITEIGLKRQQPPPEVGFEEVFEAEFSYVCRTLRRLGAGDKDLDDLAQDVFIAVYRRFGDYDSNRPIRPWLFSFILRIMANYRRLAKHRHEVLEPAREPACPSEHAAAEARDLVHKALSKLDFDRRVVLVMHDIDGFSVPEISDALSVNVNTIYSRLRLARKDFESAVRRLGLRRGGS